MKFRRRQTPVSMGKMEHSANLWGEGGGGGNLNLRRAESVVAVAVALRGAACTWGRSAHRPGPG